MALLSCSGGPPEAGDIEARAEQAGLLRLPGLRAPGRDTALRAFDGREERFDEHPPMIDVAWKGPRHLRAIGRPGRAAPAQRPCRDHTRGVEHLVHEAVIGFGIELL